MKILHVVPTYLPAVRYGGPIVSVHGLCKALVGRGHDVHVFTTNVDGPGESAVPLSGPVDLDGVSVRYFPVPALRRIYWSPRMNSALKLEIAGFDIAHTHSVFLWPTRAAAKAALARNVPYVISPRGMLVQDLVRRKSWWAKQAWIRAFEARNIEDAAAVHVTSQVEADELGEFGFELPPMAVVPNGVELGEYGGRQEAASAEIEILAAATPYLLFLGRVNWKKGLDRLVEAMALIPGVRLVIAGNDDDGYRATIDAASAHAEVADRIAYAGPVYGAEKRLLLQCAAVVVVPSYSENFGNVVLEAMAAGRPVVTTHEVGAAAIVRDSQAGLVVDGSPAALANAISSLLLDADNADAMGRRGMKAVADQYSWEAVARSMESVYEGARSRSRRA